MDIIRARPEHLELAREAIDQLHGRTPPPDRILRAFLANDSSYMILGVVDGRVVGSLTGYALDQYWSYREFFLYEINVAEEQHNRGIGTRLVQAFADEARLRGAGNVWVLTNRSNVAATRLYAKCGFTPSPASDESMMTLTFAAGRE